MISCMLIIFAVLLGIDVLLKQRIEEEMNSKEERGFFGGKLIIRKVYNRGFIMNLLDNYPIVVKNVTIVTSIGILVWDILLFMKKGRMIEKIGMTLLSAGAASNAFDRLARGKVIDYIGVRSEKKFLARFTANLGDIYIVCGGLAVMVRNLFK